MQNVLSRLCLWQFFLSSEYLSIPQEAKATPFALISFPAKKISLGPIHTQTLKPEDREQTF